MLLADNPAQKIHHSRYSSSSSSFNNQLSFWFAFRTIVRREKWRNPRPAKMRGSFAHVPFSIHTDPLEIKTCSHDRSNFVTHSQSWWKHKTQWEKPVALDSCLKGTHPYNSDHMCTSTYFHCLEKQVVLTPRQHFRLDALNVLVL